MTRATLLATLAFTLPPAFSSAGEKNAAPAAEDTLTFSLEARVRGEWRENNYDFDNGTDALTDDQWLLTRLRLGVDWKPAHWLHFYVEGQDTREFFSDRPDVIGQNGAEGDDPLDLRQGYVEIGEPQHGLSAKIGRQTMIYGDKRLISSGEWTNPSRSFDSIRFHYAGEKWWLDAFTSSVVRFRDAEFNLSDWLDDADARDEFFSGLYFSTTALDVQVTDVYVLELHEEDKGGSDFVTLGTRMKADPLKLAGWDYETEMAVQFGERFGKDLRAFAGHWGGGYNWLHSSWKPRVGLEYNYSTGDSNAADGRVGTFQNLFPTNHLYYGYMDVFSWQNLHNPALKLSVEPSEKVKVGLDYHLFWLANTNDAWYRSNQITTVRPITPGAGSYEGSEIDFTVLWKALKQFDVQAGYSHFFAGHYLSDTGASSDSDFAYLMMTFKL
ncbi:MAG: alginate export family protein [Verrucomicrobiaceae bacterium]|nr:alginate export family protein [Verrucomicrobiaceae bacterium]